MSKDFEIIPAIDILDGKCVRLTQGLYNQVEEFSCDPLEVAKRWVHEGADRLHIVDLDGAKEGKPINQKIISKLAEISNIKIQVGGGIRTKKTITEYLQIGVNYLIIGTKAFQDKDFFKELIKEFGERIILGLDLKDNKLAISGWLETVDINFNKLNDFFSGVSQIIYTDTSKDGTLSGPNITTLKEIASSTTAQIIASGGISSIKDIISIAQLKKERYSNLSGVILGKSIYKGTIKLSEAIELSKKLFL